MMNSLPTRPAHVSPEQWDRAQRDLKTYRRQLPRLLESVPPVLHLFSFSPTSTKPGWHTPAWSEAGEGEHGRQGCNRDLEGSLCRGGWFFAAERTVLLS